MTYLFLLAITIALACIVLTARNTRVTYPLLLVVPVIYLIMTRDLVGLGVTTANLVPALVVGTLLGLLAALLKVGGAALFPRFFLTLGYKESAAEEAERMHDFLVKYWYAAPLIVAGLAVVCSFQELFYRGYLQTEVAVRLGTLGLNPTFAIALSILLVSLLYIGWVRHLERMMLLVMISSVLAGLAFVLTDNIMAPNLVVTLEYLGGHFLFAARGMLKDPEVISG